MPSSFSSWGTLRAICSTAGAVLGGPAGAVVGSLVSGLLQTALSVPSPITMLASGTVAGLTAEGVQSTLHHLSTRLGPEERQHINHDLQTAFRDALREGLHDMGGQRCFPAAWQITRDVPPYAVYPLTPQGGQLWRTHSPLAEQVCDCLQSLTQRIAAGTLVPLNPLTDESLSSVQVYLSAGTPLALGDAFYDQVLKPALAGYPLLVAELPGFESHLRRYALDRTLVHLGELLKARTPAWRAFNRALLEEVRGEVRGIAAGQDQIVSRLDALLAQPDGAFAAWSDSVAQVVTATGEIQKQVGEGFDAVLSRVVSQHQELLGRLDRLMAVTVGLSDKVDRVLRILGDGRYAADGVPPVPLDAPPAPGAAPYKGMQYFDTADASQFFGRELLVADLIGRLRAARGDGTRGDGTPQPRRSFLAVVGASGSGKSSLLRAGVIPALTLGQPLADGSLPPADGTRWQVHVITPTDHPLEALAATLTRDQVSPGATIQLAHDFSQDARSLRFAAVQALHRSGAPHLLLVVDQFEELFTLCHDEPERRAFVANLLAATEGAPGNGASVVSVVIALRADFYAACAQFDALREALEQYQAYIGPMRPDELRRAVEEPARRGGWEFERGLVDLILRDVGSEPGALPLLSHALLETWQRRRGRVMTLESYAESGGVHRAIAQTAEAVWQRLTPEQQGIARGIFLRLTELGEGTQDTRRRAALSDLTRRPDDAPRVQAVLRVLTDARLVTVDNGSVEVAHEALIREWPTLRRWLDEDRAGLRLHRQLGQAAQEWQRADDALRTDLLYRGARLTQAQEWAAAHADDLNGLEEAFLRSSRESAERQVREREAQQQRELQAAQAVAEAQQQRADEQARTAQRLRRRALVLAGITAIAGVLALLAFVFARQAGVSEQNAQTSAGLAQAASTRAVEQQLSAEAASTRAVAQQGTAEAARAAAEQESRLARAGQLAAESQAALATFPQRATLLALEALTMTRALHEPASPAAENALREALRFNGGIALVPGHDDQVNAVAFSPDGRWLATGSTDTTARLWDVAHPASPPIVLRGHAERIYALAFSPDGRWLATGSTDTTVRLWDMAHLDNPPAVLRNVAVVALVFSPDGRWLATGSDDHTARLWDVAHPDSPPVVLRGHQDSLKALAFSPDGRWLATGSLDATARLWDVTHPDSPPAVLRGHMYGISALAFSPDGRWLASGGLDATARLWDVAHPDSPPAVLGHDDAVDTLAFSPDGHWLATGSWDRTARLWDVANPANPPIVLRGHQNSLTTLAFSPDGRWLATGSLDTTVWLWDVAHPDSAPAVLRGHENAISALAFSPDGRWLATGGDDATARLWDVAHPAVTPLVFSGHEDIITTLAFSPDGRWLATGSWDRTARLWDVTHPASAPLVLSGHDGRIYALAFSPDGRWLATGSGDTTARLWDVAKPASAPLILSGHEDIITTLAFSPDGRWLATGSWDHTARLWDVAHPASPPIVLRGHAERIYTLAFSPDGRWLATGGDDHTARLWDVAKPDSPPAVLRHDDTVDTLAFSPDGHWLATGSRDRAARLWDVAHPASPPIVLRGHAGRIYALAFSPDGRWLATGSLDATARLWDVAHPDSPPVVLRGHADILTALAFSPDGRWLATSSWDHTARLWDVAHPASLPVVLRGHANILTALAFSPDGRWLATGSEDATLRLWDMNLDELTALACRTTGRNLTRAEWEQYLPWEPYRQTCPQWPLR